MSNEESANHRILTATGGRCDTPGPWTRVAALAPTALWLCAAAGMLAIADRGWIPFDEGQLAQCAERTLQGELPHRDFYECYTGGLTYLHALCFWLFGVKLSSMRVPIAALFLATLPAIYAIAARGAPRWLALLLTATCAVWTLPQYVASMPSWYNLFLALLGTAALLRWRDSGRGRWIFAAGVLGGLSILAKVIGLYFVGACVLSLLWDEQDRTTAESAPGAGRSRVFLAAKTLALGVFALGLVGVIGRRMGVMEAYLFLAPGLSVAALVLLGEARDGRGPLRERLRAVLARLAPLGLGALLPVAIFVIPFARAGALGDLVRGVFVLPQKRLLDVSVSAPTAWTIVAVLPLAALLLLGPLVRWTWRKRAIALVVGALFFAFPPGIPAGSIDLWIGLVVSPPVVVLAACVAVIATRSCSGEERDARGDLVLLACVAAMLPLVQFPYFSVTYVCYAAPAVALCWLKTQRVRASSDGLLHATLLVIVLAAGAYEAIGPGLLGRHPAWGEAPRAIDRSGLIVAEPEGSTYARLVEVVRAHSPEGGAVFASPDCPEVSFLCARRNPTPILYENLAPRALADDEVLAILEEKRVRVVVVNAHPFSSPRVGASLREALRARFPEGERVGWFEVRWRS